MCMEVARSQCTLIPRVRKRNIVWPPAALSLASWMRLRQVVVDGVVCTHRGEVVIVIRRWNQECLGTSDFWLLRLTRKVTKEAVALWFGPKYCSGLWCSEAYTMILARFIWNDTIPINNLSFTFTFLLLMPICLSVGKMVNTLLFCHKITDAKASKEYVPCFILFFFQILCYNNAICI